MRIYLASRYSRREELCGYRAELIALGFDVQSRWLNGEHQLDNTGIPIGENGEALVEGLEGDAGVKNAKNAELRAHFANDDWEDVTGAQLVINFTEPPRSSASRGGRHVEFGIALGRNIPVVVVGYRENIFHWLPNVQFAETWEKALGCVVETRRIFTGAVQSANEHGGAD